MIPIEKDQQFHDYTYQIEFPYSAYPQKVFQIKLEDPKYFEPTDLFSSIHNPQDNNFIQTHCTKAMYSSHARFYQRHGIQYEEVEDLSRSDIPFQNFRYMIDSDSEEYFQDVVQKSEAFSNLDMKIFPEPKEQFIEITPTKVYSISVQDSEYSNEDSKKKSCTCSKSGCIKKYCQCYKAGEFCGKHCECINCHNCDPANNLQEYALTEKKTACFKSQEKRAEEGEEIKFKCHCQKSKCRNNYCPCRAENRHCSQLCNCFECSNCQKENERNEDLEGELAIKKLLVFE